jgi:hypothetical protein
MKMLATLDRFLHRTGLDLLTPYAGRRPRNLRWFPLLILASIVAGYAMLITPPNMGIGSWRLPFAGAVLFAFGFGAANLIRLFGPRLSLAVDGRGLDERESIVKARAGSISGAIVTVLVVMGCFYGGYASVFGWWMPRATVEWVYLGLSIEAFALTLPVLVASWLQPRPDPEDL